MIVATAWLGLSLSLSLGASASRDTKAPSCNAVQLLDAGIGPWSGTMKDRIFSVGEIDRVLSEQAQTQRTESDLYFAPGCADVAQKLARAAGIDPRHISPLNWKAPAPLVVAAAPLLRHAENDAALFAAIERGDGKAAAEVVGRGVDFDASQRGRTPLQLASEKGLAEIVRLLLDAGALPNAPARPAMLRPLALAVSEGRRDVVELLLDHGAGAYEPGGAGFNALCHIQTSTEDIVKLLLARGAQPDGICRWGSTMWEETEADPFALVAARIKRGEVLELFLEAGIDPNADTRAARHRRPWPMLCEALNRMDAATTAGPFRALLAHGAKPDAICDGYGALHLAAMGHAAVAQALLEKGARVDVFDQEGRTPLHEAAAQQESAESTRSILQLLISHRAAVNAGTSKAGSAPSQGDGREVEIPAGSTPLDVAVLVGNDAAASTLRQRGGLQVTSKGARSER